MKYYHSYIILFIFSCLTLSLNAQSEGRGEGTPVPAMELDLKDASKLKERILPVNKAYVYMEPIGTVELDPVKHKGADLEAILANQKKNCKLVLTVFSPATIARIHVKMGSAEGQADFVSHAFNFDQNAVAPFSYVREGKTIVLGLGQFTHMGDCFGEVVLEDINGKRSAPRRFSMKG